MDFFKNRYYRLTRILFIMIGLWPDKRATCKRGLIIFCSLMFISAIILEITTICTSNYNWDVVSEISSITMPTAISIVQYIFMNVKNVEFGEILQIIKDDWSVLKRDERELEIIRKYSNRARLEIFVITTYCYSTMVMFFAFQLLPIFLDLVAPRNESRKLQLIFPLDYFVDQHKYFVPLYLHMNLTIYIAITSILTALAIIICVSRHTCGMFKVVDYRLQCAFDFCSDKRNDDEVYDKVISAVKWQKKAIKFMDVMNEHSATALFFVVLIFVLSLSISLFLVFNALLIPTPVEKKIALGFLAGAHFAEMFILFLPAQSIVDHSVEIVQSAYSTRWYLGPLKAQKLLILIMRRSADPCMILIGKVASATFETYAAIVQTSISYFTMLYSLR